MSSHGKSSDTSVAHDMTLDEYESLADRINSNLIETQFDKDNNREFVPEKILDDIITREAIKGELSAAVGHNETEEFHDLVTFIAECAKKLFAIALCDNFEPSTLYNAMRLFKDHDWRDEQNLPIKQANKGESHELLGFGPPWNRARIKNYYNRQWTFQAPVFKAATTDHSYHDFKRSHILPFIERHDVVDEGSFGRVYKYSIHPNHLDDPEQLLNSLREPVVAVKEISHRSEDRQKTVGGWERETSILQKMNALRQEHIVRFITAFRRGDSGREDYYLMFEWADGINLRCLWRDERIRPCLTARLAKAAVRQILGLATALCIAHCPETRPSVQPGDLNFRHGDLKPENILWFKDRDGTQLGTLKIADWGLAKQNDLVTPLRNNNTTTGSGTSRYKPPEEEIGPGAKSLGLSPDQPNTQVKKRSRLYDVWAMGCITLEFLVWLLYGIDGLRRFNNDFKTPLDDYPPFYQVERVKGKPVARVHDIAVKWMSHMAKDPACAPGTTALGSLLELVRGGLLVVKLPVVRGTSWDIHGSFAGSALRPKHESAHYIPPAVVTSTLVTGTGTNPDNVTTPSVVISAPEAGDNHIPQPPGIPPRPTPAPVPFSSSGPVRALTTQFLERMRDIYTDDEEDSYWFTEVPRRSPPTVTESSHYDAVQDDGSEYRTQTYTDWASGASGGLAVPAQQQLADDWNLRVDNDFARKLFAGVKSQNLTLPQLPASSSLCEQCQDLRDRLFAPTFDKTYTMSDLKANAEAQSCDLCVLLWNTCKRRGVTGSLTALVERVGSSLRIHGSDSITLSIFRSPDLRTRIDENIQVGFAQLPEADSETHFEVIKHWLNLCDKDKKHSTCHPVPRDAESIPSAKEPPKRLIEVGKPGDPKVYLRVTDPADTGTWVALSHRWGPKPHFCTTVDNIDSYLNGVEVGALSATFRDAVTVTRALGCRYLWIDSLCIVQGDGGDFNEESKRMPQVYSGAYCVLAASRAANHYAGFLRPRKKKEVVALRQGEQPPFYISENIDDFNGHVLESELNSRGWVLQEHALARRTVFFTDHQTYFECGQGVRCETMMTMRNDRAAFLGDPNFPQIIQKADQGEKILLYQDLYERYSRLGLSNDFDRPVAIDGLQARILAALRSNNNTKGGLGVFDEGDDERGLLRRSLLWLRAGSELPLARIAFPAGRAVGAVPSWSWMAYTGAIRYVSPHPPFGGVRWEDLRSPWSGGRGGVKTETRSGDVALVGEGREYDPLKGYDGDQEDADRCLVFDVPGQSEQVKTLCVVLGVQTGVPRDDARCYLLLVGAATVSKHRTGEKIYERVGAGYLPGRCIEWSVSVRVTIH